MKGMQRLVAGMVVAGAVVASMAIAEDTEAPAGDAVKKPRHERRERPEGAPRAMERFKAADTDGNGTLSLAEFTVVHEKRVAEMKARMGDKWNEEQAAKRPAAGEVFTKLDTDSSGGLTPEEMAKGIREGMQKRHERRGEAGQGGGGRPHGKRGGEKEGGDEAANPPVEI